MTKSNKFSPEVRERAVRLVQEHRGEYPSLWAAIKATLNKPSKISAQTWMTQFFGLLCLSRGPFGQFAGR